MKKSKKIILGSEACLIALASFGCVYGPPPDEDIFSSSSSVSVTEYNPSDDMFQPEYGVPEYYNDDDISADEKENTTEEATNSEEKYNPAYEEQANVYGPPPDMGE